MPDEKGLADSIMAICGKQHKRDKVMNLNNKDQYQKAIQSQPSSKVTNQVPQRQHRRQKYGACKVSCLTNLKKVLQKRWILFQQRLTRQHVYTIHTQSETFHN